jgi:hypothetical protein
MPTPRDLVSRAIEKVAQPRKPKPFRHPFDVYRNPDADVPQDGVRVRSASDEIDRAAGHVTDEMREGLRAAVVIAANQDERRRQQAER